MPLAEVVAHPDRSDLLDQVPVHLLGAGNQVRDVSAEAPCAEFHKALPRERAHMTRDREPQQLECDLAR